MYPNYNYYPGPAQQQPNYLRQAAPNQQATNNQGILKGHPVTSLDEAKAASIDFDGSIFFFPDFGNQRIYTKQINMDGTSTLSVYELKEMPVSAESEYVTKEELQSALEQLRVTLTTATQEIASKQPEIKF